MQTRKKLTVILLVADNHRATLFACTRAPKGHVHVRALAALQERWDPELHRRKPSRADASGHSFDNRGHLDLERIHRFAKEIATWLPGELSTLECDALHLFSAPRLLGALRQEAPANLQQQWIEHAEDLASWTAAELARRPEIAALLPPAD